MDLTGTEVWDIQSLMPVFFFILVVVVIAVIFRLFAGGMDHDRVREYVRRNGGRVIEANWAPLGPGWFGEQNARIYKVRYIDRDDNEHLAHCKTSMWSGVYFTQDDIVRYAERQLRPDNTGEQEHDLLSENMRLREELDRLRQQQESQDPYR